MTTWLPIPRFGGVYWVSDDGQFGKRNPSGQLRPMYQLKGQRSPYPTVRVVWEGKRLTLTVHREIALVWLPNPEGRPSVRHLDDVKTNNMLSNLAWGGARENANDSVRNGTNKMAGMTHCANGLHERTPENLVQHRKPDGRTTMVCRPCFVAKQARGYARNAEKRRQAKRDWLQRLTQEEREALYRYHTAWNKAHPEGARESARRRAEDPEYRRKLYDRQNAWVREKRKRDRGEA